MDNNTSQNKNVSNNRSKKVRRERYISSIEANVDLQLMVKRMSAQINIKQKDMISKAILETAIQMKKDFPDIEEYLMLLHESAKLIHLKLKPKVVTEKQKDNVRKLFSNYIAMAVKYDPNEFDKIVDFIIERKKALNKKYVFNPETYFKKFDDI